ncbi:MAG: acetyl-CoA carboxylase biotin carboxyl carrier protein [Eggerthellaceae bacterium]|jgi:acetyl-CoA carboxylase biotin carboxyl carrier protein|nr:acetyl-CoA carboxylase biotin carboxyl carrier protein [Eggerthellaceae bacterium]
MDKKKLQAQTVRDLLDIMDEGNLSAIRYKDGDVKIELERTLPRVDGLSLPHMAQRVRELIDTEASASGTTAGAASAPVAQHEDSDTLVRSPMVGTFYVGPSPDEDPFVKPGQEVLTGQTLAIVEAMKMMNEIKAPAPGIVTEVLAANGAQVEYDQPLFRIATEASAQ